MLYPVTSHTNHVGCGSTFVSCKSLSSRADAEQRRLCLIEEAIERGATTVVVDRLLWAAGLNPLKKRVGVSFVVVDDCRKALARLSSAALGNPADRLQIIGITGTKGKTSTAFLVEHILRTAGYKTGLLGSVKNKILDEEYSSSLTTPESDDLHMFFRQCVDRGVTHVVMEVSSHAIAFSRVHNILFSQIGFTNLAPEHMDFHPTMEHYFATKTKLFSQRRPNGIVVINGDDAWGLKAAASLPACDLSLLQKDKTFKIDNNLRDGLSISIDDRRITVPSLFGNFNAYNVAMAYFLCKQVGVSSGCIADALATFLGIPGRLQLHKLKNGARAFVDYAHNPSSFEAVLKTLRSMADLEVNASLIVLFGCGGDRDKTKRPEMGRLAAKYGDRIFITDDNPRNEDSQEIISQIYAGIPEAKRSVTSCILDRKKAISQAVSCSGARSIIALLGKGHETYYLCRGKRYRFDDFEEIGRY